MKKYIGILAVVALVAAPAMANMVTFQYGGRNYSSSAEVQMSWAATNTPEHWHGGAFTATVVNGSVITSGSSLPFVGGGASFNTFCVESVINLNLGTKYVATVDTWAAQGDGSTDPTHIDFLNNETAWIYSQYISQGNKIAKAGGGFYTNQEISAAIWKFEGESGGVQNALYNTAVAANFASIGDVRVLNLWTLTLDAATGNYDVLDVQSQLIMIPAPAAIVLGMLGLGLVGWAKRRTM